MPAPSNIDSLHAIELGPAPNSFTQDVNDAGTTYTVWYKWTASINDVVGIWIRSTDFTTYKPRVYVWSPDDATRYLQYNLLVGINVPIYLPVVAGNTHYIEIVSSTGNVGTAVLHIDVTSKPNLAIQQGNFVISGDRDGYPIAIIDATNGTVRRYVYPAAAGEGASIVSDGTSIWENIFDGTVNIYDANYNLVTNVVPPFTVFGNIKCSSNKTSKFYIGDGGASPANNAKVTTVSKTGVLGPTVWDLGLFGLSAIAPSNDETILYYTGKTGVPASNLNSPVSRWDLINNVALADLAPAVTGYETLQDILVLDDNTILVPYYKSSPEDCLIKRYNASGTVLNTYDFGANRINFRLARALNDPTSFYVWVHLNGTSPALGDLKQQFVQVDVASGVQTVLFQNTIFQDGIYGDNPVVSPPLFGNSDSCPFLVARTAAPPSPPAVSITKVANSTPWFQRTRQTFTITVTNTGGSTLTGGVTVTETVPTGLTFVSMSGTGWTVAGNVATRTDNLAAGASYPALTVTVDVDANAAASLINSATVSTSGLPPATGTTTTTVTPADLSGIYKIVPGSNKTNDTLWLDALSNVKQDVKIPNPAISTALIGD